MGRYVGTSLSSKTTFTNKKIFTTTDVFVPSSVNGSDAARITVIGPGANGSSTAGGAAGGFAQKTTFLKPGCVYCVTVGTSGTSTSFGSVVTATSGSGQTTAGCGVGGDINFCGGCGASCIGYFNCCFNSDASQSWCNNARSVFNSGYGYCFGCCMCFYCCMLTAASGGGSASVWGNGCNAINACRQPGLGSSQNNSLGMCYGTCACTICSCDVCLGNAQCGPSGFGGLGDVCGRNGMASSGFHQAFTCGPQPNPGFICQDTIVPFTYVPFCQTGAGCAGSTSLTPVTISTCSREFIADVSCPHPKCALGGDLIPKGLQYYCCNNAACGQFTCIFAGLPQGRGPSNCTINPLILNTICRYVPQSSALFGGPLGASGGADIWYFCCLTGSGCNSGINANPAENMLFGCCLGTTDGCFGSGGASRGTHWHRCSCGPGFNNNCQLLCCRTAGCGGAGLVIVEW